MERKTYVAQEVTQGHQREALKRLKWKEKEKVEKLYLSVTYLSFLLKVQIFLLFFHSTCKRASKPTFLRAFLPPSCDLKSIFHLSPNTLREMFAFSAPLLLPSCLLVLLLTSCWPRLVTFSVLIWLILSSQYLSDLSPHYISDLSPLFSVPVWLVASLPQATPVAS